MKTMNPPAALRGTRPQDETPLARPAWPTIEYLGKPCPVCGGHLCRVPRQLSDHLLNLFVPVRRYVCKSKACDWQGLLRHRPEAGDGRADGYARGNHVIEPGWPGAKRPTEEAAAR